MLVLLSSGTMKMSLRISLLILMLSCGLQSFFRMGRMLVRGSGYEDTKFQAELCTTVSLKGILSGKCCNQTWLVNECFTEAVDLRFYEKYTINESLDGNWERFRRSDSYLERVEMKINTQAYKKASKECIAGTYGKSAQFWKTCTWFQWMDSIYFIMLLKQITLSYDRKLGRSNARML